MPELEAVLTEDTTWTFTMPGQGVLGPVAGRPRPVAPHAGIYGATSPGGGRAIAVRLPACGSALVGKWRPLRVLVRGTVECSGLGEVLE